MTVNELMERVSAREKVLWEDVKRLQRMSDVNELYYSSKISEWSGVYELYLELKAELEKEGENHDSL